LPFARSDVDTELPRSQLAKADAGLLVLDLFPARCEQTEARDDDVAPSAQLFEHALGVGRVLRLAEDAVTQDDGGVDSEHGPPGPSPVGLSAASPSRRLSCYPDVLRRPLPGPFASR